MLAALAATLALLVPAVAEANMPSAYTLGASKAVAKAWWATEHNVYPCGGTLQNQKDWSFVQYDSMSFIMFHLNCGNPGTIRVRSSVNWESIGNTLNGTAQAAVCSTVMHELGHGASYTHSGSLGGYGQVMHSPLVKIFTPCRQRFPGGNASAASVPDSQGFPID